MTREKKKRMMMRHLLTTAKLIGLIPRNFVQQELTIEKTKLEELAAEMTPKRPSARSRSAGVPRPAAGGGASGSTQVQ